MIVATQLPGRRLVTKITDKNADGGVTMRAKAVNTASLPARFTIKTNEIQLRGPRGLPADGSEVELPTDPTVWFILALE